MRNKKVVIAGILAGLVVISICILVLITSNNNNSKERSSDQTSDSATTISLISPTGAPALSLAGVLNDDSIALEYEIVDGSDVLSAAFMSGETDIIIAPINLGLTLMQNGADYSLLGVVSWGNLYVVGTNSNSGSIAAFGQSAVPGKVLEYVQSEFSGSVSIDWYSSVSEVAQLLLQGEYSAALLAEPVLSSVLEADESLSILYDIQELYTAISGNDVYPQAAIFVNNTSITSKTENIIELCNKIDMTVASYNNDASTLLTLDIDFSELGFADVDLLVEAYERMALDFEYACDVINELNELLALFDITLDETMYVQ